VAASKRSSLQFTLQAVARGRPVYEAEARHDWDAVLYRFLVAPGEVISSNVLSVRHIVVEVSLTIICGRLERTLQFSRNDAADSSDSRALLLSQHAIAAAYYRHCSNAISALAVS